MKSKALLIFCGVAVVWSLSMWGLGSFIQRVIVSHHVLQGDYSGVGQRVPNPDGIVFRQAFPLDNGTVFMLDEDGNRYVLTKKDQLFKLNDE